MYYSTDSDINVNRKLSINKHRKKQAANDAQLLMSSLKIFCNFLIFCRNRIALLQKEEERARKKVEQTKDRAKEIIAIRSENEIRVQEWVEAAENERRLREETHRKNFEQEEESRMLKVKHIEEVMMKKKQSVEQLREMKQKLREDAIRLKEGDIRKKQQMRLEVKRKEEEGRLRRQKEKEEFDRKAREYYENKVRAEEEEARRAEKLVQALERKEREWLERLRSTQTEQERAFHELENTLQGGSEQMEASDELPQIVTPDVKLSARSSKSGGQKKHSKLPSAGRKSR